jgi:hypothetical protein
MKMNFKDNEMTKAIIRVQGDPSVGIAHQWYNVDNLELLDQEHATDVALALRVCFARISGEHINDVTVRFVNDEIEADEKALDNQRLNWKVEGLTDTYYNEQRN